jgi:hypothetical protein
MRHSDPRQTDLFRRAEVVAFPVDRWIGTMRAVAAELLAIPRYADRNRRWKAILGPMRRRLIGAGIPPDVVDEQLEAFRAGVLCQARRHVILEIIHGSSGGAA